MKLIMTTAHSTMLALLVVPRKVLLETTNEDKTFGFERLENDTEYRVGKNLDDPKISVVLKHGLGIGI